MSKPVIASDTISFYHSYDIRFYDLDLHITDTSTYLFGQTTINAVWLESTLDTFYLELTSRTQIDSIIFQGINSPFLHHNNLIRIPLPEGIGNGTPISLTVFYEVPPTVPSSRESGVFNKTYFGNRVTYTLSEPFFAREWFPCKQDLMDKADSVHVYLTMEDRLLAGSNGVLVRTVPLPDNLKRMEWESGIPIAYYLISFAVSEYRDYSFMASVGNGDSVLVQNYIYDDSTYFADNKQDIDATAEMMELFSDLLSPYPFRHEKYGHCVAPMGGGMEHQTMTTLQNFNFRLVAHELAHQWFGNNVTCAGWSDIWINEGFASYGEYLAYEYLQPEKAPEWLLETHEMSFTRKSGSIYVPPVETEDIYRIFDYPLSYRKGAAIIHMLRHEFADDELFFSMLSGFQSTFKDSIATGEDFRIFAESFLDRSLVVFFDQWYYGEGYPVLDLKWEQKGETLSIYAEQSVTSPDAVPCFDLLLDFEIKYLGGDTLVQFRMESCNDSFSVEIPGRVYQIFPDPENWLLMQVSEIERLLPEGSSQAFNLFPNPATDTVFIENFLLGRSFSATVYSGEGKLIRKTDGVEAFTPVDIHNFTPGNYQVVIESGSTREIFQLVVL